MLAFETYIASWDSAVDGDRLAYYRKSQQGHQDLFDRLRNHYRPISVTGTQNPFGSPSYSSVWARNDGRAWLTQHGIRADDFQERFDQARSDGYRPVFMDGFGGSAGPMFNSVWERDEGPVWNAEFGIPDHEYQRRFDLRCQEGLRLRSVSPYSDRGALMYATTWDNTPSDGWVARHGMSLEDFNREADAFAASGHVLTCARSARFGTGEVFAALWERVPGTRAQTRQAMDSGTFVRYNDEMRGDNLRLRSLSATALGAERDSLLAFRIQRQSKTNWCWVACASSIAEYYGVPRSQCALVNLDFKEFGHHDLDCCADGTDGLPCNNGGDLGRVLRKIGLANQSIEGHLQYAVIERELVANRPIGIYVILNGGGHHLMVITGCQMGEFVRIANPAGQTSDWFPYSALTNGSSFTWSHSVLTKKP